MVGVLNSDKFCKSMLQMLMQFFFNVLLPGVVTRKLDVFADNQKQNCCLNKYCKQPYYEPMIACDNMDCTIEWFHYACI